MYVHWDDIGGWSFMRCMKYPYLKAAFRDALYLIKTYNMPIVFITRAQEQKIVTIFKGGNYG
jgi:hypothetical protein